MLKRIIFAILVFSSLAYSYTPVSPDGCGETKGCLRPNTCPEKKICDYLATWKSVSEAGASYVEFELVGRVKSQEGFIYMRFSDDKIEGDDGLIGCYKDPSTGRIEVKTGYISSTGENRFYDEDDPNLIIKDGGNLGGSMSSSGVLECRFQRLVTPTKDANLIKDLSPENPYHIGVYRGSRKAYDGFGENFPGGAAFYPEKASVSSPIYGSYTDQQNSRIGFAKAHGMTMVLAWVFCASVGTIISRYYKLMMPNKSILSEPLWFQAHRILMGLSVGLTILGVILIVVYCQGYSQVSSWPHYVHPILGFIVLALALINPFVALFRCRPNSPKRAWHNWIHFIIGIVCFCLSFIQMFLGLRMTGAGYLLASKDEPISLLIFFVIFQFCVEIILEIHGCIYFRRNEEKFRIYQENRAQHMNDERLYNKSNFNDVLPEPSGRVFKYFMLGLHITVASIVTVVLMIMIAVY